MIENQESKAIVQHLFALAVQRIGGASGLGRHLGVLHSELRTYLAGDAMPPTDVLLKMVELVIEDLKAAESQFPEEAWRSPPLAAARKRV